MPPKKDKKGGGKAKGGKGGKKGKEKGKKGDKEHITHVDRTFYELTITDLNNKLAHLRSYKVQTERENEELTEKLRTLNEDRSDVTAHLDRTLIEKIENIRELDERYTELSKTRETENATFTEKIKDWETKYKAMKEQLTSEIKLLNGKLNSLEEFRVQRDRLLAKFDEQEEVLREHQRMHKETVYSMEQKAIIEKDALKKEVESKLLLLSEDFTKSSEIRNAGYTRRLIRENISLTKEIDSLILSQMRMMQEYTDAMEKANRIQDEYMANEELKQHLIKSCQNKIEIIEKLTSSYESLKVKFVTMQKYRKLYENLVKRDICERFSYNDVVNKTRILKQRIDALKREKSKLIAMHQQHEMQIMNLREIIQSIRQTVQLAIEEKQPVQGIKRKNLLCELLVILAGYSETPPDIRSIETMSSEISTYRPGTMGFMPHPSATLMDLFKREGRKIASVEQLSPDFKQRQAEGKYIPKPRSVGGDTMVDVEYGSTLYMSGTADEGEAPVEEEKAEDEEGGDYGSSSTAESGPVAQEQVSKQASVEIGAKEPSPKGSELAVQEPKSTEYGTEEEQMEEYEGEEEEEEFINLFY